MPIPYWTESEDYENLYYSDDNESLKDKYGLVTNDKQETDTLYKPIISRINNVGDNKLNENGLLNRQIANDFFDSGLNATLKKYHVDDDINVTQRRVVPTKNEYFQMLYNNIQNLSDDDIADILNKNYKTKSPIEGLKIAYSLYPYAKKLGLGIKDIPKAFKSGKDIYEDINVTFKQGGKLSKYSDLSDKERYDVIKAGVKAGYTSLDDIEKYYNEFATGGDILGNLKNGSKVDTTECAAWSNGLLRDNGYLIYGNAWNLKNVDPIFNGYDTLERPSQYDLNAVRKYNHDAADRIYKEFDSKTLDPKKNYVVNMYYNGSPQQERAYNEGRNTGTHTGTLTYDEANKRWMVTHNVHGTLHQEPFIQLQSGKNKYGVTAIYAPRENTFGNRVKGFFGFANGGHIFNGEEFSDITDQDVYLQKLKQQQQQKLNLNPNFTNQMWNGEQGLNARLNSNDFLTQEAARREVERQNQFQNDADSQTIKKYLVMAHNGNTLSKSMKNEMLQLEKDIRDNKIKPGERNQKYLDIINKYKKIDEGYDTTKYNTLAGKLTAQWTGNKELAGKIENSKANELASFIPVYSLGNLAANSYDSIKNGQKMSAGDFAEQALYSAPAVGKFAKAGVANKLLNSQMLPGKFGKYVTPSNLAYGSIIGNDFINGYFEGRNENSGSLAVDKMNQIYNDKAEYLRKNYPEYFDKEGNINEDSLYNIQQIDPEFYNYITSNNSYTTTNDDGTQTYNPYQQMVNANIADRSRKIQAEQAAKAATQTTTAPTSTLTQTTDTKVRVPVPTSMQTTKQQTTQQPVQQQITQQKPTKMQGFMNKLGSAAPYIGDFVGWTLGNSKFFKYGGNIYETKDLH